MNNVNDYLLSDRDRPDWLTYPPELVDFVTLVTAEKVGPWDLFPAVDVLVHASLLKKRLGRDLIPFANRTDREDLACFEKGQGGKVLIIHDNTDPGWENEGEYPSVIEWIRDVEEEARHWDD